MYRPSNKWDIHTFFCFGFTHSIKYRKMMTRLRHFSSLLFQIHKITIYQWINEHMMLILYKNTMQKKVITLHHGCMNIRIYTKSCALEQYSASLRYISSLNYASGYLNTLLLFSNESPAFPLSKLLMKTNEWMKTVVHYFFKVTICIFFF